jgi:hypothetical protein
MIRVDAMEQHLNLGIAQTQFPGKIGADTDDPVYFSGAHEPLCLRH